ncbi:MAG: flagellar biosynthetic protein FliR [Firmicutes bacterium]|nr:flagellar biosynthetic protein FliR [Bacillota bacterium]
MRAMENILLFSLMIMRTAGFIALNPILGRRNVPTIVKGGFIIMLSLILISYSSQAPVDAINAIEYSFWLLKEFAVGFVLGMVVNFFLSIIVFAGESIDMQMGLSMAKVYDASSNTQISLSATFYNMVFMLLFFSSDAHLALIRLFLRSGETLPYGAVVIGTQIADEMVTMFCDCLVLAVRLAMPMIAAEMLVEVGVGILMKTIPQINVFVVNIQTKIIFGLVLLLLIFSPTAEFLGECMKEMLFAFQNILTFMR